MNLHFLLDQIQENLTSIDDLLTCESDYLKQNQQYKHGFLSDFYNRKYCIIEGYLNALHDMITSNDALYNSHYQKELYQLCQSYRTIWLYPRRPKHFDLFDQTYCFIKSLKNALI